jgi:predicted transcriptional regulator
VKVFPFLKLSMPRKEKIAKAKLAVLIAEQVRDAESNQILPERITPRKRMRRSLPGITETELIQLVLEFTNLSRRKIAQHMHVTPACVSQHRFNTHKKFGPEFTKRWKKFSRIVQDGLFSLLASSEHLPYSQTMATEKSLD